jgi:hypothetical protein
MGRLLDDNIEVNEVWREILRKICGRTKLIDGTWRIKTNEEIGNLIEYKNIIHFIEAQRLRWLGHVESAWGERR